MEAVVEIPNVDAIMMSEDENQWIEGSDSCKTSNSCTGTLAKFVVWPLKEMQLLQRNAVVC